MKRFAIFTILLLFVTLSAVAQSRDWRRYRHELVFGAGTAAFMGDLGGGKGVGTHFVKDFDIQAGRWAFMAAYGYKLSERFTLRSGIYYGRVYGSDEFTPEYARNGRNLTFRSPIVEINEVVEFSVLRETYGHRYRIKRAKGKKPTPNIYLFAGVGGFFFNPKAQYPGDEKWYALQPLGTEGQGYFPTRKKYSRIQLSIPFGVGMNALINRSWGIGFDFGFRYTLTDYIDDVSNTYVSPDIYDDPIANYFANPGSKYPVKPGEQRGENKWNDAYMFLTIKATYKLFSNRRGRSKF